MRRDLPLLLLICAASGIGLWFGIKGFSVDSGALEPLKSPEAISAAQQTQVDVVNNFSGVATDSDAQSESEPSKSLVLGVEEISRREKARQLRFAELGLLPEKPPEPTVALDVSLIMPDECADASVAHVPIGLKFRYESSIIRGESMNDLQSLVSLYKDCELGEFVLDENPLGDADANDSLKQMRLNEVKYFFIQHSVPIQAVRFPEK